MKPWKLASLFHPSEVSAAFAALQTHAAHLYGDNAPKPLARFTHRRGGKGGYRRDHVELPLQHFYDNTDAFLQLPAEVRYICAGLHDAAYAYVDTTIRDSSVPSSAREDILRNLGKKSVLRVLRYPTGSGCRPHVDPGLCTALLAGSAGGLEVNTIDEVPVSLTNRPGDYTTHVDAKVRSTTQMPHTSTCAEGQNVLDLLPHWEPVVTSHSGEVVVMASNTMGLITSGKHPGVLHRVRRDWGEEIQRSAPFTRFDASEPSRDTTPARGRLTNFDLTQTTTTSGLQHESGCVVYRFNVIVELRPAEAKRWYAATRSGSGA